MTPVRRPYLPRTLEHDSAIGSHYSCNRFVTITRYNVMHDLEFIRMTFISGK